MHTVWRFRHDSGRPRLRLAGTSCAALLAMCGSTLAQTTYVTNLGSPGPRPGDQTRPFSLMEAAVVAAPGHVIQIEPGRYHEKPTLRGPCTLTSSGAGNVKLGDFSDVIDSDTLKLCTLNTHLFGDVVFTPSWMDYPRAEDIADFLEPNSPWFGPNNPRPDVVAFQEIWDEDLFYGGDGAEGILPASGYLDGVHGLYDPNNPPDPNHFADGVALMSTCDLFGVDRVGWFTCHGWTECGWDCLAGKGWVQAWILKGSFQVLLISLHTDAGECEGDRTTRIQQMEKLRNALLVYRVLFPSAPIFIMGDFNIFGEETEYGDTLIGVLATVVGARDADRNSPGFDFTSNAPQWTVSTSNMLAMYFDCETRDGRLDYIFYCPSLDGTVEVLPKSVDVVHFVGANELCDEGNPDCTPDPLCTYESSDHWSVIGDFQLLRVQQ